MGSGAGQARTSFETILLVTLTVTALWLSLAVTAGLVLAKRKPFFSVPGWHSSASEAEAAVALVQRSQKRANLIRASELARQVLLRDPLNVIAVRTLGLVAGLENQTVAARRWFRLSQALSRRDLPTQLWLIEDSVAHGKTEQTLKHYDYALSTTRSAESLLFPVLVGASSDANVSKPLAAIIKQRPLWWGRFIDELISTGTSPSAIVTLVNAAHLDLRNAGERQLGARAVQRLLQLKAIPQAFGFYRRMTGVSQQLVHNGNFEKTNPLPPLDWDLTDQTDIFAAITNGPTKRLPHVLALTAVNGKGGVAAQQLLHVLPGSYIFAARVSGTEGDASQQPRLQISCQDNPNSRLVDLTFPPRAVEEGKLIEAPFQVSRARCEFQQLQVIVPGSIDSSTTQAWITAVSIKTR